MEFVLELAGAGGAEAAFDLVRRRAAWLEARGIRQWGEDYLRAYPLEYYEAERRAGRLYLLRSEDGSAAAAAVLLERDGRWPETGSGEALYIHNLAADPALPGAGRALIAAAERLARARGKASLRLDCAVDNPRLNAYYDALGFAPCGGCSDGPYRGLRREKRL